jgi:predicted AAA+ superfamily ATPase
MTTSRSTRNTVPEAVPAVELPAAALARLADAAERLVEGLAHLAPPPAPVIDWKAAVAFRWRRRNGHGQLLHGSVVVVLEYCKTAIVVAAVEISRVQCTIAIAS